MFRPEQAGGRKRYTYARADEVLKMPHLLDLQTKSYEWFQKEGLRDVLDDISPIEDGAHKWALFFKDYYFGEEENSIDDCRAKAITYCAPLKVRVQLVNRETGEIKENDDLFMGDFPIMTSTGTFVINGAERVIVSQLVRSPGVYFSREQDNLGKYIYSGQVIPNRGAWIELESDANGAIAVRIDRNRKMPATVLVRALGWSTNEDILELFNNDVHIQRTLEKDPTHSTNEALIEIYKKLRPGEPPTVESATTLLHNLFYDPHRYDLARVGRYKAGKKLGWKNRLKGLVLAEPIVDTESGEVVIEAGVLVDDEVVKKIDESGVFGGEGMVEVLTEKEDGTEVKVICNNCNLPDNFRTLTPEDMIANIDYLLNLMQGYGYTDDIDHLGNRRVRCVGELLQNQFRIGLSRMERVVRERMTTQDQDKMTPQALVNIRPVVAAIKEFFGSSQLSQFMDQTNPLAELTHKRRLSALGPGGLSRERAGFEVRDVHYSHYGRMCPVETPEGPNIGLISSLANYGIINKYGLIETPYRLIDKTDPDNPVVTDTCKYVTADIEEDKIIAQASEPLDKDNHFVNRNVTARRGADPLEADASEVDLMDVSPKQVVSIGTSLIPFLEHDDTNRALMGANMQRQAVPLLRPEAPLVGTGMEFVAAQDSGVCILADHAGTVKSVDGNQIVVQADSGEVDTYPLIKFMRSNQSTCINQRPLVYVGDRVEAGQTLADGMATDKGELALGQNVLVAFVSWEGYNHEDAVLISERMCKEDLYTSIHIEEYECDARDTKLGDEEITRQLPSTSEDAIKYLDENGIISVGADVRPGDILVGKVTPKGETELTPEERLLRAIFGDKEREVRDTSLRVPHGEFGKVVDVKVFSREEGDELSPGVNKSVRVYIAQKRKIHEGDKMAGRHGNKCVCSRVLPVEDMPFTPDGRPVDLVLNPLGVPSRMNIGQILEIHLGWACHALGEEINAAMNDPKKYEEVKARLIEAGYDFEKYGMPVPDRSGIHIATPVFDGCRDEDLATTLKAAGLPASAKSVLYDGRTGEKLDNGVTIGWKYMLKLHHLVDDKIHARSTGPYSLVTQQPLGGKAQFGGQRFGEMEVWALEAYGAAYTLQEILTVKSDDVIGRVKAYEKIVKGENIPAPGVPESFKVLMKELQSIGLDVRILNEDGEEVVLKELDDDDLEQGYGDGRWHDKDGDKAAQEKELKEVMEGENSTHMARSDVEASHAGEAAPEADTDILDEVESADQDEPADVAFTITDDPNAGSDD